MSVKDVVEAIAESIQAEVTDANDWTFHLNEPIWRNPEKGTQLAIYGLQDLNALQTGNTGGGGFRASGYHEDIHEIVVEYIEPAPKKQSRSLTRDADTELDLYDRAESLRAWSDAHQSLPGVGVHRFDWLRTSHAPQLRNELLVRFFQLSFYARVVHQYAG